MLLFILCSLLKITMLLIYLMDLVWWQIYRDLQTFYFSSSHKKLHNESYDMSKTCWRMFMFAKLLLNGQQKNICVGKFSNFRSRPSWKKSRFKLWLQKNNSPSFSQFSANNCKALPQTYPCVWPMLCSWPSGRSSLGLYNMQYVLSAACSIMRCFQSVA